MIYLDNAATTKPRKEAVDAAIIAAEEFGNPSSLHGLGLRAEKLINEAKDSIAKELNVEKKHIYFTSGGTEANNLAIFGAAEAMQRAGKRVITSRIEHPSVLEAFGRLSELGYDVVFADAERDGRISVDSVKSAITPDTILVSVMHVNNETGVIQPVKEIADAVKAVAPKCIIHSDCVQSFCKIPVVPSRMGADMVTISAHKIHGYKGCGALYTGGKRLKPQIYGGEQQDELRPGTENTAGILAFGAACRAAARDTDGMRKKRELMRSELLRLVPDIIINGSDEYNSGTVLNVSFLGIKAEILLHSLERHEIYVSTGSACSSHKPQPSHVLTAMGADAKAVAGAVRISFAETTTEDEIMEAAGKIAAEVKTIRRYMR
ncbi:MAG TPA: cysteine desulfurase [Candidatus Ornithomonoglobus merdipullorum]|uniref:Cysteine desulfurase n=1 Tax=Candidatus Ornithomonoglobus merdipullorum TaxID=2840895 RepID=A0A9D1MAD9_9FIRM|nr:cysteine desulfurase [Candidatus Ornithomonoglobus merdipullorum]